MITRIATIALLGAALTAGCNKKEQSAPLTQEGEKSAEQAITTVSIQQVASYVKDKGAVIVDANNAETRKEYGVIPGALLLSGEPEQTASQLPPSKDTKLVFYCGGVMCRASDKAASRATAAGYKDVSVLREGIKGWKGAGQPTDMPTT